MSGLSFWVFFFLLLLPPAASYDGPFYDSTAYTECKALPEKPLYNGGILRDQDPVVSTNDTFMDVNADFTPAFVLHNLTRETIYCFSIWVKAESASSAQHHVRARLKTGNKTIKCVGSVLARHGCRSFLKRYPNDTSINIEVASASLQPFTQQQWRDNQQYIINTVRKRAVTVHVSDKYGDVEVDSILHKPNHHVS